VLTASLASEDPRECLRLRRLLIRLLLMSLILLRLYQTLARLVSSVTTANGRLHLPNASRGGHVFALGTMINLRSCLDEKLLSRGDIALVINR
jgi:hypothetical protein